MKTFIVLILSCASVFGADTGIQVVTTARTNAASGAILSRDVFMRDGQTNLVRVTLSEHGAVESQNGNFYHNGVLVGEYWTMKDSSGFITEAGSPYTLIFRFGPSNATGDAFICTKDRVVLDYFTARNGLFYPADSSALQKANGMTTEMNQAIKQ